MRRRLDAASCTTLVLLAVAPRCSSARLRRERRDSRATLNTSRSTRCPSRTRSRSISGIQKGFFAQHGIEIKKKALQSGNDIVLALANDNGDIGYLGYVPAMIARTQGIPFTLVAASEVEGTSRRRQLAEHHRQGQLELDPHARQISPARRSPSTR